MMFMYMRKRNKMCLTKTKQKNISPLIRGHRVKVKVTLMTYECA